MESRSSMWVMEPEPPAEGAIWLLYGGHSEDGRGPGILLGYTFDYKAAVRHFRKIKADPYSTGKVIEVREAQSDD